jgi:hypothetical protein
MNDSDNSIKPEDNQYPKHWNRDKFRSALSATLNYINLKAVEADAPWIWDTIQEYFTHE